MATSIGTESTFDKLITNLLYLEHDAIAAYDTTIDRLKDATAKEKVISFKDDHLHHVETLTHIAGELGIEPPQRGDAKQMLTTGKVAIAGLVGDSAVLKAMRTNEEDTVTAYERATTHKDAHPESKVFFEKALGDEQRHRAWMQDYANKV